MDNWADYAKKRILSCTESGGWNFEPTGDLSSGGLGFAIAIDKQDGSYTYYGARSNTAIANLNQGWHFLCGTYDG
jgi:hypothetical protein